MKKVKIPHTFTIIFIIIVVCAVATWFVPGGEFARESVIVNGTPRTVVTADSFHTVDNVPQTWQVFSAFFKGFEKTANIIVFILMLGGAFQILNHTKAIDIGVLSFLSKTQKLQKIKLLNKIGTHNLLIVLIMLMFSIFGAVFGMSEETIAFIAIFIPLSISMGYDSVVGVLMCYVAAHIGFAGALFNPFTLGIAQGLSGLQPFSGLEYRFICWLILTFIAIAFTLWYASRVKKNPQKSFMYELDEKWRHRVCENYTAEVVKSTASTWVILAMVTVLLGYLSIRFPFTHLTIGGDVHSICVFPVVTILFALFASLAARKSVHSFIVSLLVLTIVMLVVGVLGYDWYVMEIASLFLAMGFAAGIAYGVKFDAIVRLFLEGCKELLTAALVVGLAGGIIIILEDGRIIDTMLYAISQVMGDTGEVGSVGVMYLIQNALNIIIPSGSAKAALTIPMMSEFSDIIGLSRQVTVLAFQFGDGFTNIITPTSGVLIGVLGVAGMPYTKWLKFILPFVLFLIVVGFLLLLPPIFFPMTGF
ncbi:MAG: AbgT family transporter [Bacteroidales bacterium]|nr:AbgT family transporter [Bacteroidales bacterium]